MKRLKFETGVFRVLTIAVFLVALMSLPSGCGRNYGTLKKVGACELYHTSKVTAYDAKKFADYLKETHLSEGDKKTLRLDKKGDTYIVQAVMLEGADKDPENLRSMERFAVSLSAYVFNSEEVELQLCDDAFKPIHSFARRGYPDVELIRHSYFTGDLTESVDEVLKRNFTDGVWRAFIAQGERTVSFTGKVNEDLHRKTAERNKGYFKDFRGQLGNHMAYYLDNERYWHGKLVEEKKNLKKAGKKEYTECEKLCDALLESYNKAHATALKEKKKCDAKYNAEVERSSFTVGQTVTLTWVLKRRDKKFHLAELIRKITSSGRNITGSFDCYIGLFVARH